MANRKVMQTSSGWIPAYLDADEQRLAVMSIAFLLPKKDGAVVWRGPKKNAMIKQFVGSVAWGDLDYLFVDTPPGTSDEHLAIVEALQAYHPTAIIVTTPQLVAISDVEKEISFCGTVGLPILGVIENMSGYACKRCSHTTNIFSSGGGEQLAEKHALPFLGRIPINPDFSRMIEAEDVDLVQAYRECSLYPTFKDILSSL